MFRKSLFLVVALVLIVPAAVFGADKLIVQDSSSTTQFVVQDIGNTGIGTATPQSQLYVVDTTGTNTSRGMMTVQHSNGSTAAIIQFKRSRGTEASPLALASGDNGGAFHSYLYDGSAYQLTASVVYKVNGTVSSGAVPTDLLFYTGSSSANRAEKMRITSAGNVGIANAAPAHLFSVGTGAYSDGTGWFPASSREYKDNIKQLSVEKANETLKELNPVTFTYKTVPDQAHIGFIAEDVPNAVAMNDRKSIDPVNIIAVLTKVMQDKSQTIEKQQKTLDLMAAKLEKMESEINRLKSKDYTAQK